MMLFTSPLADASNASSFVCAATRASATLRAPRAPRSWGRGSARAGARLGLRGGGLGGRRGGEGP